MCVPTPTHTHMRNVPCKNPQADTHNFFGMPNAYVVCVCAVCAPNKTEKKRTENRENKQRNL